MLREAMWAQDVDLTCLLVEYGADTTMSDRNQLTPLHVVARRGSVVAH